jgi:outer membrane receptor protein involved in Fe transport
LARGRPAGSRITSAATSTPARKRPLRSTRRSAGRITSGALGGPDYIRAFNDNGITRYVLRVKENIQHNAWVSYRFNHDAHAWLRDTSLRFGINNVLDTDPPLTSDQYGFRTGTANPRGRQFTMEVSKKF